MKQILLFITTILITSCSVTKERMFFDDPYTLSPPVIMCEKSKCLGKYVITVKDSKGFLLIEGKDKRLRYLYKTVPLGDTLTPGQINIINSK